MKSILKWGGIALLYTGSAFAQVTETTETTETTEHEDGSVTETTETTTRTFEPEVQTRVVKYFDTYKTERYGLPPVIGAKISVEGIPTGWRTTRIAPGVIVAEKERSHLMVAPPELVKLLPAPRAETKYYVAGSNVVAVDKSYKVVDSIHVPSIKYVVSE